MSLKNSNMGRSIATLKVCIIYIVYVLTCTTGTSDEATEFQAVALLLLVLPLVVGQAEDSVEGPVCSQRVLQLREFRANSNLTVTVKTCVWFSSYLYKPIVQKPEKLSVGSMLLVVTAMAVGACLISLAFGKLTVRQNILLLL